MSFADAPAQPPLGDIVVLLLAGTLAGLRDRLAHDGYLDHADLVADLVEIVDEHLARRPWGYGSGAEMN